MAFAQDLLEGFANATGDQNTVNRLEKEKTDRRATQHEELQAQTQSILNDVTGLQQKRSALDPKHPTYKEDLAANDQALHDARQALTDLYHPEQNPGALNHLGGFIRQHLSKNKPQVTPATAKKSIVDTMAGLDAAAAPGAEENPFTKERRQLVESGMTPEDADKAIRHKAGIDKTEAENWQVVPSVTLKDGRTVSLQHNTKSGEWSDLAGKPVPADDLALGTTVPPKASGAGPVRGWKKKNGKNVSVLIDRNTNKEIPGSENPDILPPANISGRITTGFHYWEDDDHNIHATPDVHTSMPANGSIPATPGEAKDRILGVHSNAPTNKASNDVVEATKLASVADQVAQRPNDAVNQKRLAVALERASAGRFTTQALDYIIKAGWGNTIEGWANSPTTGALPADVVRQLVDGAHENLKGAQTALAASKQHGEGGDAMITVQIPGQKPGKIHASQKAAFLKKYPNAVVQ